MDAARTLREKTEHYRELAQREHHEEIANALREVAECYAALAKEVEAAERIADEGGCPDLA
jgi:hypothetical protein